MALSGTPPFVGKNKVQVERRIKNDQISFDDDVWANVSK